MKTQTQLIIRGLKLVWTASGIWSTAWAFITLVQGVLPAAIVYLTKLVVDSLATAVNQGVDQSNILTVAIPAGLMVGVMIAQRVFGGLIEWVNASQTQLVQDHIKGLIHRKSALVDYSYFDSPAYFDQFQQANTQGSTRTLNLLRSLGSLAQGFVTFVSIAAILSRYSIWLPLFMLITSGPAFYLLLRQNRKYRAWWKETTSKRRWANYLDSVLTSRGSAGEIRLCDLADYFIDKYRTTRAQTRQEELSLIRRRVLSRLAAGLVAFGVTGLAMGWIVLRAMRGQAGLGDLSLFYQSFNQGQTVANTLLGNVGEIHNNAMFLEQVFDYLDQENQIHDPEQPIPFPPALREGVCFNDLSFTYPGAARPAIDQFRLEVPAKQVVAVVGANGAGKSTLINLLCRFYDPSQGVVTVDGIDLRDMAQKDLRRQISVMFQFPMRYHLSVADNIAVGDLHGEKSRSEIEMAARGAGAHEFISRLPQQYDNLLGKSFEDAAELSGGEWQRIALARAFLRQAQIIVLDEPTSLMDSWGEAEWLERFRDLVVGKTVLIITHRFTTAMKADVIHVMDGGRIIESGTHPQLLELGGKYASSWHEQVRQGFG